MVGVKPNSNIDLLQLTKLSFQCKIDIDVFCSIVYRDVKRVISLYKMLVISTGEGGAADGCAVGSCRSVCSLSPAALGRFDGRRLEEEKKARQKLEEEEDGAAHLQP